VLKAELHVLDGEWIADMGGQALLQLEFASFKTWVLTVRNKAETGRGFSHQGGD
jgi:hypothetical protein